MEQKQIDGQEISRLNTMSSKYDNGKIINATLDTGEVAKINVDEFLKILNGIKLTARKAKKYWHLTINE